MEIGREMDTERAKEINKLKGRREEAKKRRWRRKSREGRKERRKERVKGDSWERKAAYKREG